MPKTRQDANLDQLRGDQTPGSFEERLEFDGDISEVVTRVVGEYALGDLEESKLLTVGFQDYNVRAKTTSGEYLLKFFSKDRDVSNARRYVEIMQAALDAGVCHPSLLRDSKNKALHVDEESGLNLAVLGFIAGKTFYDMDRAPTNEELKRIAAEAVKINSITYKPAYLFDTWAIPNIHWMYEKTERYVDDEGKQLVGEAFERYDSIPINSLPKCFVHGDIIKPNTIVGDDGKLYVIDFAVSNIYPRIQELAVMASNLMFGDKAHLQERVDKIMTTYLDAGGELEDVERTNLFNYALPGAAMEFMGGYYEQFIAGDTSTKLSTGHNLGWKACVRHCISKQG
jgi:Ser/Thr protein kinase RdoA (MazF antagonist)